MDPKICFDANISWLSTLIFSKLVPRPKKHHLAIGWTISFLDKLNGWCFIWIWIHKHCIAISFVCLALNLNQICVKKCFIGTKDQHKKNWKNLINYLNLFKNPLPRCQNWKKQKHFFVLFCLRYLRTYVRYLQLNLVLTFLSFI